MTTCWAQTSLPSKDHASLHHSPTSHFSSRFSGNPSPGITLLAVAQLLQQHWYDFCKTSIPCWPLHSRCSEHIPMHASICTGRLRLVDYPYQRESFCTGTWLTVGRRQTTLVAALGSSGSSDSLSRQRQAVLLMRAKTLQCKPASLW